METEVEEVEPVGSGGSRVQIRIALRATGRDDAVAQAEQIVQQLKRGQRVQDAVVDDRFVSKWE